MTVLETQGETEKRLVGQTMDSASKYRMTTENTIPSGQ